MILRGAGKAFTRTLLDFCALLCYYVLFLDERLHMTPQTTSSRIIGLVFLVTIITIADSYIPQDITLARSIVSYVILGLMALIVVMTLRAVARDF